MPSSTSHPSQDLLVEEDVTMTQDVTFYEVSSSPTPPPEPLGECLDDGYQSSTSSHDRDSAQDSGNSSTEETLNEAHRKASLTYINITHCQYKGQAQGLASSGEWMTCMCQLDLSDPESACASEQCINRSLFMECGSSCMTGDYCKNQRFQRRQHAKVEIIETNGKGFGLRTLEDLPENAFVMEYVGEVLTQNAFIKRTLQYSKQGVKHFYFMSLQKDEIIDATKKGNISRFINHSCAPNAALQKWIVGPHLRIGIFTIKAVQAGQEITFDYKFERYGAEAQKCLCGEPNCTGIIGGAQSKNLLTGEVMYDEDDLGKDSTNKTRKSVSVKPQKPVANPEEMLQVLRSMLTAMTLDQVHILLKRIDMTIQSTEDTTPILRKFVQFHGLLVLKLWLQRWSTYPDIILMILQCSQSLPITTRNTVEKVRIEPCVASFTTHEDTRIQDVANSLMETWSKLETIYTIPKGAKKPKDTSSKSSDATPNPDKTEGTKKRSRDDFERPEHPSHDGTANSTRRNSFSAHPSHHKPALSHHRSGPPHSKFFPHHNTFSDSRKDSPSSSSSSISSYNVKPKTPKTPLRPLPSGWESATTKEGLTYYYKKATKETQWDFPEEEDEPPAVNTVDESVEIESIVEQARQAKLAKEQKLKAIAEVQAAKRKKREEQKLQAKLEKDREKQEKERKRALLKTKEHRERHDDGNGHPHHKQHHHHHQKHHSTHHQHHHHSKSNSHEQLKEHHHHHSDKLDSNAEMASQSSLDNGVKSSDPAKLQSDTSPSQTNSPLKDTDTIMSTSESLAHSKLAAETIEEINEPVQIEQSATPGENADPKVSETILMSDDMVIESSETSNVEQLSNAGQQSTLPPVKDPVPAKVKAPSIQKGSSGPHSSKAASGSHNKKAEIQKIIKEQISLVVVNTLSIHKKEISVDEFRSLARKITHVVIEKENKKGSASFIHKAESTKVNDDARRKIKAFVISYYDNWAKSHKAHRSSDGKTSHDESGTLLHKSNPNNAKETISQSTSAAETPPSSYLKTPITEEETPHTPKDNPLPDIPPPP